MNLSSLFQKPAQSALITNFGTFTLTSSPAILTGIIARSLNHSTSYTLVINSGVATVVNDPRIGAGYNNDVSHFATGLDCPSGISVTTAFESGTNTGTNIRLNIFYVLK